MQALHQRAQIRDLLDQCRVHFPQPQHLASQRSSRLVRQPPPPPDGTHHKPERIRPSLIFKTGLQDAWELMCPQVHDRWYHSVALLLPNGRILSGGGVMPDDSTHSLESFGPPYLYQEDPPPVILAMGNPPVEVPVMAPGQTLVLSVNLPSGSSGKFRVALIQPGSVTHSTNTSPRYVKLLHADFTPMGYGVPTTILVTIPGSNNIVPPGYYMISVTSSDGVPSAARWVKIKR